MSLLKKVVTISFIALAGLDAFPNTTHAGCLASLSSDSKSNTGIGSNVLCSNTNFDNTAIGAYALTANTTGRENIAIGNEPMAVNTTGSYNVGIGSQALMYNQSGDYNSALGYQSLTKNTTGYQNTANGMSSLGSNTTGYINSAFGTGAMIFNTTGFSNTALGAGALYKNTTGDYNIAVGYAAGSNLTNGDSNIDIGNKGIAGESKIIRIGTQGTQAKAYIAGISGVTVSSGAAVYIKSDGQLGTVTSSRRYKVDIHPMGDVSDRLMNLQPVTFRYKLGDDTSNKSVQYGLIAEDVDAVMPELVIRNEDGSPETVAYHVLPSLLLNEYQKQHLKLEKMQVELSITQSKLEATDAELTVTETKLANLEAEMERLKKSMERPLAALPNATEVASAQ